MKRLAPGAVTAIRPDGILFHDATTLDSRSGLTVIDSASWKAAALHFGASKATATKQLQAPVVAGLITTHA